MTTRRSYSCNLCHMGIRDQDSREAIGKPGIGIHHHSKPEVSGKRCREAENHLCLDCINAVWMLSQALRAASTQPPHNRVFDEM